MIAFVKGKIEEKIPGAVVIDVAGVGYEVAVSTVDYDSLNITQEVKIYTHRHIREQADELYGFSSLAAKRLFELLITVQGVGPKAGLAIMSLGDPESVRNAIANADSKFIGTATGVGKKTAEKVVIDLSDRVGAPKLYAQSETASTPAQTGVDDALDALIALGFTLQDAIAALKNVPSDLSAEDRIKQALKNK
jgi:Holliday junction DNA helicase RuvA